MKYIKVKWIHTIPEEPVMLYSELDGELWEIRKVEVFADGTAGYASKNRRTRDTKLSKEPLPCIEEIGSDPQFEPHEISATEFESVWQEFTGGE